MTEDQDRERIEELRRDPDFRELCRVLRAQTEDQRQAFSEHYADSEEGAEDDRSEA